MRNATLARTPVTPVVRSSGGVELIPQENRMGSLEVEITGVALLPAPRIRSGSALAVQIKFLAHQRVLHPNVSVSITREEDGAVCLDTNTQKALMPLAVAEGRFALTFTIDRLEVMAGAYFVNVGIFEANWAHAYDYHWHAYPFQVEGAAAHSGLLAPPSRWQIEPNA
jgi:lipopolysaccharide transport system ATP-binding protein